MTTRRREQAPTNVTRRVALKAGLGTALSALSLSALRAEDLRASPEGRKCPYVSSPRYPSRSAERPALYRRPVRLLRRRQHSVYHGRQLEHYRSPLKPGFHPEARYEFKVHFDGADFETLTYRVSFGEADSDGRQACKLHALTGAEAREDSATGELVLEGRTGEPASAGGIRIWAGRIADSFYIDLSLLAKVNGAVKNGTAVDLSAWRPEDAKNSFAGTTVESIVLEVSHQHPQLRPGARIGVWCATKLATDAGGWRQINRGGHPMMWPIFWPDDTHFTNPAEHPAPVARLRRRRQVHRRQGLRRRSGQRDLRRPSGLRSDCGPGTVPRRPALRGRDARDIRLRYPQRPDDGRQRTRSNAVPRLRHGCAFRAEAVRCQEPTGRQVPIRRTSMTFSGA